MFRKTRRQFFVDTTLQGVLLTRCVLYWTMCLAAVFVSLVCWDLMVGPNAVFYARIENIWLKYAPAILFVAALTPIMAFDFLRVSNRFAGPMIRLRRSMRDLGQGERVEPVVLRRSDFWRDFADEFNAVILRMRKLESDLVAARSESAFTAAATGKVDAQRAEADDAPVDSDTDMASIR